MFFSHLEPRSASKGAMNANSRGINSGEGRNEENEAKFQMRYRILSGTRLAEPMIKLMASFSAPVKSISDQSRDPKEPRGSCPSSSVPFHSVLFLFCRRQKPSRASLVHGATEQAVIGFSPLRQVTERRRKKKRTGRRWSREKERKSRRRRERS